MCKLLNIHFNFLFNPKFRVDIYNNIIISLFNIYDRRV